MIRLNLSDCFSPSCPTGANGHARRQGRPSIGSAHSAPWPGQSEVYPALANYPSMRAIVVKHNREAQTLETAIADVDAQDFAAAEWGSAFDRLFSLVQRHAEEEEKYFFTEALRVIDEHDSKAILERFEAAKKSLLARRERRSGALAAWPSRQRPAKRSPAKRGFSAGTVRLAGLAR